MTWFVAVLDVVAVLLLMHEVANAALLRRPPHTATVAERVSVLLPMRDEADRLSGTLPSLLGQQGLDDWELLGYDDESADDTVAVVRRIGGEGLRWVPTTPLPAGWLGKPHACHRLADAATGTVLVFVDADVTMAPDAVARAVALLRSRRLAFVSPYPRQLTGTWAERLVQPLLTWSWLTFLPLRLAERSTRPSLAAANGQFLVVDTATYRRAGGHAAVRTEIVEDMALARRLAGAGGHGGFVDGRDLAGCRMYDGPRALADGYAKSFWCAFGSPATGSAAVALLLALAVLPWVALGWTAWAWPAAVAGPVSRLVAAVRSGSRPRIDVLAHPLSAIAVAALFVTSVARRRRGALTWRGRSVG